MEKNTSAQQTINLAQRIAFTAVRLALIGKLNEKEIDEVLHEAKESLGRSYNKEGLREVEPNIYLK